MKKKIKATVISQKGTCIAGHQVGGQVKFSGDDVQGKICISALYSMIPKVYAMYYDAKFPWLKEGDCPTHACPDPINPVVFQLSVIEEEE